MRKIQQKANLLRGDVPNDVILQVFIEQLAAKVTNRKEKLQVTLKQAKLQEKFEEDVALTLKNVRGDSVDLELLQQVYAFLNEQKPKLDSIQRQIDVFQGKPSI